MIDEKVWKSGEELAAKYMKNAGYKIITTNYKEKGFELDIVAILSRKKQLKKLREEFKKKEEVYQELIKIVEKLKSGKDVYLVCCCAPMLCHGDVIANAVMGIIEHEQRNR